MAKQEFKSRDRVRYAASFLKSIKCPLTSDDWRVEGTVKEVKQVGSKTIVKVSWDDKEGEVNGSFPQYLRLVGEFEPLP